MFGFFWHYPVSEFKPEFFKKFDVFIVVRNPYERAISELFWVLEERGFSANASNFSKEDYNALLVKHVSGEKPINLGHWLGQSQYIFDEAGERVVKHVLKCESLNKEFNTLMKSYKLPVLLSENSRYNATNKIYSVEDLSPEAVDAINRFYNDDFVNFGYEKI